MNRSMIRFLLAKLLLIEAVLLLVPVAIALYYQESNQVFIALFSTIGILTVLGGAGVIIKPKETHLRKRGSLNRFPLLDSLVLLWCFTFCIFRSNSEPDRCILWNQLWIYNNGSNNFKRCVCPKSFSIILEKLYPSHWRNGGTCLCLSNYG